PTAMRFQQNAGIEAAPLQDEIILFHSASNRFCVLNRTSSFIWSQLKEPATSDQISRHLQDSFSEAVPGKVTSDVDSALQEMLGLGLIVRVEDGSNQTEAKQ